MKVEHSHRFEFGHHDESVDEVMAVIAWVTFELRRHESNCRPQTLSIGKETWRIRLHSLTLLVLPLNSFPSSSAFFRLHSSAVCPMYPQCPHLFFFFFPPAQFPHPDLALREAAMRAVSDGSGPVSRRNSCMSRDETSTDFRIDLSEDVWRSATTRVSQVESQGSDMRRTWARNSS
jgi:hypothetical protein